LENLAALSVAFLTETPRVSAAAYIKLANFQAPVPRAREVSKKVAAVLGSPRKKANSSKLVKAAVKALPKKNLNVKEFHLNALNYKGCQGCFSCKGKSEICVLTDDLTPVLAQAAEADLLILASPVYIGEVTAQLKGFIDRAFSYFKPDWANRPDPSRLAPGKKLIFILTQGVPDQAAYEGPVLGHYQIFFQSLGFTITPFIAPGQGGEDIVAKNPELLEKLASLAAGL
jgi:multimeric flavodoxin WrbA